MKETEIVKACLQYLELKGYLHWRSNNQGTYNKKDGGYFFRGTKGVPDITVILPNGKYCGVEVKSEKGRLSEAQKELHQRILENNGYVCVVRSVSELAKDLEELRSGEG